MSSTYNKAFFFFKKAFLQPLKADSSLGAWSLLPYNSKVPGFVPVLVPKFAGEETTCLLIDEGISQ